MPSTQPDESYIGPHCLIDELRMAGHWRLNRPEANRLAPHIHATAFEICFVADGVADWWAGDRTYEISGGQFFITKPGELHGGVNSSSMPTEIYWVQVAIPENAAFVGLNDAETVRVREGLESIEERVFDASIDPSPLYDRILGCLRSDTEFRMLSLRIALHELILRVLIDAPKATIRPAELASESSSHIDRAVKWIDAHLTDDFSVEDVARSCGIAVSYLHKTFAERIGMPPGEYRTRGRIASAKRLLKAEARPITDIAIDLGFSSSQYFATVFKARTGMTPHQYRTWSRQESPPFVTPAYID